MPDAPLLELVARLRDSVADPADGLADADLLGRYVRDRDPVAFEGALLVDGGIVQRVPTLELLDVQPLDRLLVVLGYESEPPREATVETVLERAFELALGREILRDVELARLRHPSVDIQVLRPSRPLEVRPLDFDGERLARLVDLGRSDGGRCLDALGYR